MGRSDGLRVTWSARAALVAAALLAAGGPARAFEAWDGRLDAHGFYEMQLRTIANNYQASDGWDLTQWYHVLDIELEAELIQEPIGPVDVVSAFVRGEFRYDCIWRRGCGMFPNVDAFGDDTQHLPKRYAGAERSGFDGTMFTGDTRPLHLIPIEQLGYSSKDLPVGDRKQPLFVWHVPGVSTLFGVPGLDGAVGTADDPAFYTFAPYVEPGNEYRWGSRKVRGPIDGRDNQFLGPWLPKNEIIPYAALADRANPFNPLDFSPSSMGFGAGAQPYRPAPMVRASEEVIGDPATPRGLFLPNHVAAELIRNDELDDFDQNYSETDLSLNRGASQTDEKELREAYLDIELFDARLWLRIGKQSIVWGKTELFRTTDQFNPVDLALSSLPNLEEARISLWAGRGVLSLGDRGFFEDLRVELAMNFDEFEPNDLGRCGEPYTPNPVCAKTLGLFAHGAAGFGLLGEMRPPNPWDSLTGIEVGARVEWRTRAFSFAVTDFWGYEDLPYVDQLYLYERNVDPVTGRPRILNSRFGCDPEGLVNGDTRGCLGPGEEALLYHHANQQRFAVICSASVGFSDLDRTVCAQSVFNSQAYAQATDVGNPSPEGPHVATALSVLLAGDGAGTFPPFNNSVLLGLVDPDRVFFPDTTPGPSDPGAAAFNMINPLVVLSADPGDDTPTGPGDRFNAAVKAGKIAGSEFATGVLLRFGLMSRLSDEQEALLGCGPFWGGTDCDIDGIDLLNAEMSALIQSWPGFPGTEGDWDTTNAGVAQPGTVGFQGGAVCTRYERGKIFVLPGCRGPGEKDYNPAQDGTLAGLGRYGVHPFTGQPWNSEMAVLSWNFLVTLVGISGLGVEESQRAIDEFKITDPLRKKGCSWAKPQLCANTMALYAVAHTTRSTIRAGGNDRFGRNDFDWHVGGIGVLRYQKRNVLGFSTDFAEDRSKTNWSVESTWINDVFYEDNDSESGLSEVDLYNLTISMDRPTFVNFLNANRTLFFNTQWFFQYIAGYRSTFQGNGPWNVLATFTVETGYFQDRLTVGTTFVYDFKSVSGAILPSWTWRFTENFSTEFGLAFFWGGFQEKTGALTTVGDPPYRTGRDKESDWVENGVSPIRDRDEVYLRIRYTF